MQLHLSKSWKNEPKPAFQIHKSNSTKLFGIFGKDKSFILNPNKINPKDGMQHWK
jgi:hypothetical protein